MVLSTVEDLSNKGLSGDSSGFEDAASFPPPPPPTEISLLELPPKMLPQPSSDAVKELEIWPSISALPPILMNSQEEVKEQEAPQKNQSPPPPLPLCLPKETAVSPPTLPQSDPVPDLPATAPNYTVPDSTPTPKLSPSPGKEAPPLPTKPKPKL